MTNDKLTPTALRNLTLRELLAREMLVATKDNTLAVHTSNVLSALTASAFKIDYSYHYQMDGRLIAHWNGKNHILTYPEAARAGSYATVDSSRVDERLVLRGTTEIELTMFGAIEVDGQYLPNAVAMAALAGEESDANPDNLTVETSETYSDWQARNTMQLVLFNIADPETAVARYDREVARGVFDGMQDAERAHFAEQIDWLRKHITVEPEGVKHAEALREQDDNVLGYAEQGGTPAGQMLIFAGTSQPVREQPTELVPPTTPSESFPVTQRVHAHVPPRAEAKEDAGAAEQWEAAVDEAETAKWENRELGADLEHAVVADAETTAKIDDTVERIRADVHAENAAKFLSGAGQHEVSVAGPTLTTAPQTGAADMVFTTQFDGPVSHVGDDFTPPSVVEQVGNAVHSAVQDVQEVLELGVLYRAAEAEAEPVDSVELPDVEAPPTEDAVYEYAAEAAKDVDDLPAAEPTQSPFGFAEEPEPEQPVKNGGVSADALRAATQTPLDVRLGDPAKLAMMSDFFQTATDTLDNANVQYDFSDDHETPDTYDIDIDMTGASLAVRMSFGSLHSKLLTIAQERLADEGYSVRLVDRTADAGAGATGATVKFGFVLAKLGQPDVKVKVEIKGAVGGMLSGGQFYNRLEQECMLYLYLLVELKA